MTDRELGRLIVERGLVTHEQIEECLLEAETRGGRLSEILTRRGYLKPAELDQTLRLSEAATVPAGTRFGKYVKKEKLGEGGMGEVWLAWDGELARWVALKFLKSTDEGERARFRREAQTAAKLQHPNIAAVYEATDQFIAMQYVAGQDLARSPRREPRRVAEILRQAALAVHYAHEQGVIHRDLKPANLMVEKDRVFVMDFGLAKSTAVDAQLSRSGTLAGTPAYMSPEQARGSTLDARADVYSLGATLYELVAGRAPFRADDLPTLLRLVLEEDPAPIGGDLGTIAAKCLEKDPERRYASAKELADDLGRCLAGEAIRAHPPSVAYRAAKFLSRRRALVAVAGAGVLLAAAVAGWLVPKWKTASREKEAKERELAQSRERERSLQELGALWTAVLLAKQDFYKPASEPARLRATLEKELARLGDYIARHPDQPQGYYLRARGRLYLDELDEAEKDLRTAIALAPSFAPGEALLGRVLLAQHGRLLYGDPNTFEERKRSAEPALREACEHLERGANGRPITEWGLSRTREDDVTETLARALHLYYSQNRRDEAVRILQDAHRSEPSEEYAQRLGNWRAGHADCEGWFDEAIRLMPHNVAAYVDRAYYRDQRGDWDGAIADAEKALALHPGLYPALLNRAGPRFRKRDFDGAIADCTEVLRRRPDLVYVRVNRGLAYSIRARPGDLDLAIADFTDAIGQKPDSASAWINRGSARGIQGDLDGAIADYTEALRLHPGNGMAHFNRARAKSSQGDGPGAIADFTAAIEANRQDAGAWYERGLTHHAMGDRKAAIADYDAVLRLDPNNLGALLNRGVAYQDLGDKPKAVADWKKALEIAPPDWPHRKMLEKAVR